MVVLRQKEGENIMGLIISLLYAAYLYTVSHSSFEVAYLSATNFLFWWYLVWTIIFGSFVAIIGIILPLVGGAAGYDRRDGAGAVVGFLLGGAASVFIIFLFLLRRAMYVGGSYLLSTAVALHGSAYQWDKGRLIFGGLLILVAVLTRSRSSSSSSSKKD